MGKIVESLQGIKDKFGLKEGVCVHPCSLPRCILNFIGDYCMCAGTICRDTHYMSALLKKGKSRRLKM